MAEPLDKSLLGIEPARLDHLDAVPLAGQVHFVAPWAAVVDNQHGRIWPAEVAHRLYLKLDQCRPFVAADYNAGRAAYGWIGGVHQIPGGRWLGSGPGGFRGLLR